MMALKAAVRNILTSLDFREFFSTRSTCAIWPEENK